MRTFVITLASFLVADSAVALAAPATRPSPPVVTEPPLADVLAAAKQRKLPVFLDIYTDWCGPCARLEKEVFPQPQVRSALAGYRVQRYDAERGAGAEVAAKYKVQSYPTLLVLFPDGTLLERVAQQDPAELAFRLRFLQPVAAVGRPRPEELARSRDARVLFAGAVLAVRDDDGHERAHGLFARTVEADAGNKLGLASAARLQLLADDAREAAQRTRAGLYLDLAARFSGSPEAAQAVEGLAALPAAARPDAASLRKTVRAVAAALAAARLASDLNNVVNAEMALGDLDGALDGAAQLEKLAPDEAGILDTVAEVRYQAGHVDDAIALEEKLVARAPERKDLQRNLARFKSRKPGLPPDLSFTDPLAAHRDEEAIPPEMQAMMDFRRRLDVAVRDRCRELARPEDREPVRLHIAAGKVVRATLLDPDASGELRECIERAAGGVGAAPPTFHGPVQTVMVSLPPKKK